MPTKKKKIKIVAYKNDNLDTVRKKSEAVLNWRLTKGHIANLCELTNISRQTYYKWLSEDLYFAQAINEAEAELNDDMRDALLKKVDEGSSSDIQFYLKKKHPEFKDTPSTLVQVNNYTEAVNQDRNKYI